MKPYEHGGDVFRAARELGLAPEAILDFSASINPLGIPEGVLAAARDALPRAVHYPEPDAASLRAALARHHDLPEAHLLPGAGSIELLYLLPRVLRPRRALLVAPAFSEYERSLRQAGTAVDLFPLRPEERFRFAPARLLHAMAPDTDLVLLANPGNPSGAGIEPALLEDLAVAVREQALVAVDEAFVDFAPHLSILRRVPAHRNLYVFRSLTKFFAIPGLRAGYLAGPPRGIARMAEAREPWSLSTVALAAAQACLGEEEFRQRTLAEVPALREGLATAMAELGLTVFPSAANYLLVRRADGGSAAELVAALRRRGILIRDCGNFAPLDGSYLRVAVRTSPENGRLVQALREALG
jgi:threonine-phosphate decarboxylase